MLDREDTFAGVPLSAAVPKSEASITIPSHTPHGSPSRNFQKETTIAAMKVMEQELLGYVKTVPFREIPRYKSVPEVPRPPHQTENPRSANIYNRSALARCVLESLAADLHGSEEESRVLHDYHTFHRVLNAPRAPQLDLLDPKVVEKPKKRSGHGTIFPNEMNRIDKQKKEEDHSPQHSWQRALSSVSKSSAGSAAGKSNAGSEKDDKEKEPEKKKTRYVLDTWSRDPMRRGECLLYTASDFAPL